MNINEIIYKHTQGKLSSRPEFYAGRGNNSGDLNSDHIEMLYEGIKTEIGNDAAIAFVQMVGQLTADASATTFLIAVKQLEQNGWKFAAEIVPKDMNEAFAQSIADARRNHGDQVAYNAFLFGSAGIGRKQPKPGEGLAIVGPFLERHQKELGRDVPKAPQANYNNSWQP